MNTLLKQDYLQEIEILDKDGIPWRSMMHQFIQRGVGRRMSVALIHNYFMQKYSNMLSNSDFSDLYIADKSVDQYFNLYKDYDRQKLRKIIYRDYLQYQSKALEAAFLVAISIGLIRKERANFQIMRILIGESKECLQKTKLGFKRYKKFAGSYSAIYGSFYIMASILLYFICKVIRWDDTAITFLIVGFFSGIPMIIWGVKKFL